MTAERVMSGPPGDAANPGFRPLYRQVKDLLLKRIGDGVWAPGR